MRNKFNNPWLVVTTLIELFENFEARKDNINDLTVLVHQYSYMYEYFENYGLPFENKCVQIQSTVQTTNCKL